MAPLGPRVLKREEPEPEAAEATERPRAGWPAGLSLRPGTSSAGAEQKAGGLRRAEFEGTRRGLRGRGLSGRVRSGRGLLRARLRLVGVLGGLEV